MGNGDGDGAAELGGQAAASGSGTGAEKDAPPPPPPPLASRPFFLPHIRKSIMPIDEATQRKVREEIPIDGPCATDHSLAVE